MKKAIKRISAIVLLLSFAVSLSGCKQLDEAKKSQAFFANSKEDTIALNGAEYKALPECEYFEPDFHLKADGTRKTVIKSGKVTKKDIPVLLSGLMGYGYTISANKELLRTDYKIYAKSDLYGKYIKLMETYECNILCAEKWTCDDSGSYINESVPLTEDEAAALKCAVEAGGEQLAGEAKAAYEGPVNSLQFVLKDSSMLFEKGYCSIEYYTLANKLAFCYDGKEYLVKPEYEDKIREITAKYFE